MNTTTSVPMDLAPQAIDILSKVTTATLTTLLLKKGLRNVWLRGAPAAQAAGMDELASAPAPLESVPVFRLIEAFERVISKSRVKITHDVVVDRISISDKINQLVDRLDKEGSITFMSCFEELDEEAGGLRQQMVVTFLAILEMTRLKMIRIHQPSVGGEIYVSRAEGGGELGKHVVSSIDEEFAG